MTSNPSVVETRLCLWRAPTDNDRYARPSPAQRWATWGLPDATPGQLGVEWSTHVEGDRVEHIVVIPESLDDLPRVGVRLTIEPGFEDVEWFGRGPHESYNDRCASARVGLWRSTVTEMSVPYVHPQANGNRHGVRRLRVTNTNSGASVTIEPDRPLDVTVAHVTDEDLHAATHVHELAPRAETYVWLDAAHRGVGTGAVGPDTLPQYRVTPGTYRWSYTLR